MAEECTPSNMQFAAIYDELQINDQEENNRLVKMFRKKALVIIGIVQLVFGVGLFATIGVLGYHIIRTQYFNKEPQVHISRNEGVRFFAYGVVDTTPIENTNVVFKSITVNNGSCYNGRTGDFIVPLEGLYWFKASLCSLYTREFVFGLYIDEKLMSHAKAYSKEGVDCVSDTLVMLLRPGHKVSVRVLSKNNIIANTNKRVYLNYFTGVRIR